MEEYEKQHAPSAAILAAAKMIKEKFPNTVTECCLGPDGMQILEVFFLENSQIGELYEYAYAHASFPVVAILPHTVEATEKYYPEIKRNAHDAGE